MLSYVVLCLCAAICAVSCGEMDISQAISDAEFQGLAIPEEHDYRIPTINHYGYMFTKFDPVVDRFLEQIEKNPKQTFFEVGGAYGNVAKAALEKGIENYYLNDCEERHLKSFVRKLKETGKTHLFQALHLMGGRCPEEVAIRASSFDAILINKVLHFFTPDTIDAFVQWLSSGLKSGGLVFVLTISPFYKGHEQLLQDYQKKKEAGVRFPGYCAMYKESNPAQKYPSHARPTSLLFMELDTLKSLFQKHGFQIEEEFELASINSANPEWARGKDMVGIVARKP